MVKYGRVNETRACLDRIFLESRSYTMKIDINEG